MMINLILELLSPRHIKISQTSVFECLYLCKLYLRMWYSHALIHNCISNASHVWCDTKNRKLTPFVSAKKYIKNCILTCKPNKQIRNLERNLPARKIIYKLFSNNKLSYNFFKITHINTVDIKNNWTAKRITDSRHQR